MAIAHRGLRRLLIALAAIAGTLPATGEVSACSTMTQDAAPCATACGCCSPADEAPATPGEVAQAGAVPRPLAASERAPIEGCSCRSQAPAAPTPKPARGAAEGRAEPDQNAGLLPLGDVAVARFPGSPQVPATQSPPRVPLYLRNERLLF